MLGQFLSDCKMISPAGFLTSFMTPALTARATASAISSGAADLPLSPFVVMFILRHPETPVYAKFWVKFLKVSQGLHQTL